MRCLLSRATVALAVCLCVSLSDGKITHAQGFSPAIAADRMTAAEGLHVTLFASEPDVRQPIFVKCDDRGRVWTIQYLQYPNPAGLKRVKVDRWSRTVYDRVPEPPPRGPAGDDRITILEDTDKDGRADRVMDFLTGLNLCTGVEFGHGGVYVLQAPYLLFYPDADRNDVPDGDPRVLLSGFGMEDAQSLANHLTWGPDGWLYGLNGSTTTCLIRGIEFQQGVWRYHPVTEAFELFCEGGGNPFGLTFDEHGNLFYSANGGLFWHARQGASFEKNFGKHGPLHHRFAYGFLGPVVTGGVPGSPTTGGLMYLGDSFPAPLHGKFLCGDFLGHTCSWWTVSPSGATVTATYGGRLLDSHDTWFGATDLALGPDGAVYVADFHDQRTAHPDPDAQWDRSNGRIYRLAAKGTPKLDRFDVRTLDGAKLLNLLHHKNGWWRNRARVELAHRRDRALLPELRRMALQTHDEQLAREALWAMHVTAGIDDNSLPALLAHPSADVRTWTVRFVGETRDASEVAVREIAGMLGRETELAVLVQAAATIRRLPGTRAIPLLRPLLLQTSRLADRDLSLMTWWACEAHALSSRDALISLLITETASLGSEGRQILERLARRYAADGSEAGDLAAAAVWANTPSAARAPILAGISLGLSERAADRPAVGQGGLLEQFAAIQDVGAPERKPTPPVHPELRRLCEAAWNEAPENPAWQLLALRAGVLAAVEQLRAGVLSDTSSAESAVKQLTLATEFCGPEVLAGVRARNRADQPERVQLAALAFLARHADGDSIRPLLVDYGTRSASVRERIRELCFSRAETAQDLLEAVDAGTIAKDEIPLEELRRVALHKREMLDALVRKHWGNLKPGTPEEKLATIRRFQNDLRATAGDAGRGKSVFEKQCAACHQLFGTGGKIGPDLTNANRQDTATLLANIVDPSAVIRTHYLSYVLTTTSGRVLTGLLAEQDGASVTLLDARNERTRVLRSEIESLNESAVSLMPEGLLEGLAPQELRDLVAYLKSGIAGGSGNPP